MIRATINKTNLILLQRFYDGEDPKKLAIFSSKSANVIQATLLRLYDQIIYLHRDKELKGIDESTRGLGIVRRHESLIRPLLNYYLSLDQPILANAGYITPVGVADTSLTAEIQFTECKMKRINHRKLICSCSQKGH